MPYRSKPDRCHAVTMSVFLANDQIPETTYYTSAAFAILMLLVVIVGFVGNTIAILVFRKPSMKSSVTTLIIGMTVNDQLMLLFSLLVFELQLVSPLLENKGLEKYIAYAAVGIYPFLHIFKTISVWILMAITCERYIVVRYPLLARSYCTRSKARRILAVVVSMSVLYNIVRFWDFKLVQSCKQETDVVPSLMSNSLYIDVYLVWLNLLTKFLIPFILLIGLNFQIVRIIRKSGLWLSRRASISSNATEAFDRRNSQISMMMVVIVIVFLCTNLLPLCLNVADAIDPSLMLVSVANDTQGVEKLEHPQRMAIYYFLLDACNLMVVVNAAIPVFVYVVFCRKFRTLLADLLRVRNKGSDFGVTDELVLPLVNGFVRRYTWNCDLTKRDIPATVAPAEV